MKTFTGLLFALLLGAAFAFLKPAEPVQQVAAANNMKPAFALAGGVDALLDNPNIEADNKITPARKCGFCIG